MLSMTSVVSCVVRCQLLTVMDCEWALKRAHWWPGIEGGVSEYKEFSPIVTRVSTVHSPLIDDDPL